MRTADCCSGMTITLACYLVEQRQNWYSVDYFLLFTDFFNRAPAENLATFDAGIFISAPVAGLRPLRAARFEREKVPKPINATGSPLVNDAVTVSMNASKVVSTDVLVLPVFFAIAST